MPPKMLTEHQLNDTDADVAVAKCPPVDDAALVLLRNLQAQVTDLDGRVTVLEGP